VRLFIAVNVPQEVRRRIWRAAAPLRERRYPIRWVGAENVHLTIKFLGEVGTRHECAVVELLDQAVVGVRAFCLSIGGFGAFPNPRRARVVWVACAPDPVLELLQRRVEEGACRIGFPPEDRPFHPHLTLGRVTRGAAASALSGLEEDLKAMDLAETVSVASVELMLSTLSPTGALYTVRHSARFPE